MTARLFAVLPALLLSACVLSLEPLYTEADVAFDPALVGTWKPADADESWKCRKSEAGGEAAYRVVYRDERRRTGEFSAHLVSIEGKRFLDLYPVETSPSRNSFYADHWIAAHTFARVLATTPKLELAILDEEWLGKLLAEHPEALAHKVVRGQIVITAATTDLRRFLVAQIDVPGAFRPMGDLHKAS